ncbi:Pyruvate synthase subunit PorA [subsurface metagenome]
MKNMLALTGNEAVAQAMRQINPDVLAAYPITPQTEIVMAFSRFVADGVVDTETIPVESEHSAMSACVGAAASGARTMTATCSQGLALMWEIVYIASSLRLPIVMPVVNRALSAPINIHCDHSDSMGARDSGWIQIYCESGQEAYESTLLAVRIAEDEEILLPVMVCLDGFITSHAVERIELLEDKIAKDWIGEKKAKYPLLDIDNAVTYGPLDLQNYYFEHKRQEAEAMIKAYSVIPGIVDKFEKVTGKKYDYLEEYKMDGAELAVLALSSTCGTAKTTVDRLREKGVKAGMVKLRFLRPFPAKEVVDALSKAKAVAILDRSDTFSNSGGPVFNEIRSAFYEKKDKPLIVNHIYGLGGRDINVEDIEKVYTDLGKILKQKKVETLVNYLGVRE